MAGVASKWFWEFFSPNQLHGIGLKQTVYSGQTAYQQVDILDTGAFGRCLVLDGKLQSAEADEFIYHEALVHPLLITHPNPRRVLVAGGGEGATLREVLAHRTVEQAVMVDLDHEVVDLCKRHLPQHHRGSFDDPRAELRIADARDLLVHGHDTYDAIVLDLPDPLEGGPAYLLYTQELYCAVMERLAPGGGIVVQAGSCQPTLIREVFTAIYRTLASVFPVSVPYRAEVDSFGGLCGFVMASRDLDAGALDATEVDRRIAQRVSTDLRFYDGTTHEGILRLPRYLRQALEEETRVITNDTPLFVF